MKAPRRRGVTASMPVWLCLAWAAGVRGDDVRSQYPEFERHVWPIFSANCVGCHGAEAVKGGLDVRTVAGLRRGGKGGPALDPADPESSLLLERIARREMPPGKARKLTDQEAAVIRGWIKAGARAEHPDRIPPPVATVRDEDRQFWSFRHLATPSVPTLSGHGRAGMSPVRTPIDAFLLSRLVDKGLSFSADAEPATLVRRVYLDLLGLPPSPQEVDAYTSDDRPGAFERLLDRALASPHFGERWGRHWLDVAGYVDTVGFDTDATTILTSVGKWRYRDYVIHAFNADKPYDRFLTEQLAGDELHDWRRAKHLTPAMREALIATGYLRTARDLTHEDVGQLPQNFFGIVHDTIEIVGTGLLGLTVNCARCHTHKFDPIPHEDYYRLMAVFAPAYNPQAWLPVIPTETQRTNRGLADLAPAELAEAERFNAGVDRRLEDLRRQLKQVSPHEKTKVKELETRIAATAATRRAWGLIQALYDHGPTPVTHVLLRGNEQSPGPEVRPGFLRVLSRSEADAVAHAPAPYSGTTGRRSELARWLTRVDSPAAALAARVMVNRVWKQLFGQGIVATPDNFGAQGMRPTHPELLEWLSGEFVASGWRVKSLIKQMMMSTAYRQSSHSDTEGSPRTAVAERIDPGNQLLWRMRLRRLESEVVRDAILAVSGDLNQAAGGPPVMIVARPDGMVTVAGERLRTPADQYRRSVYLFTRRAYNLSLLTVFDQPLVATNCLARGTSAVPLQSLFMINDAFLAEQAAHLSSRVEQAAAGTIDSIETTTARVFRMVLARPPNSNEIATCVDLWHRHESRSLSSGMRAADAAHAALTQLCLTLLNTSEFLFAE